MEFKRKSEFFGEAEKLDKKEVSIMTPKYLFRQERDWTCAIACLKSIVSSIKDLGTEDEIVSKFSLVPGPLYSKDIKN